MHGYNDVQPAWHHLYYNAAQHSTGSRFTERQPTHLLYTTNVGQQRTGWTVINQGAKPILHTCMQLITLHALSGLHNGMSLLWGLRFAFDHRSCGHPALQPLTVQCPGSFVCRTQTFVVLPHLCKGFIGFAACILMCSLMLCQQRMLQLVNDSNCNTCCISSHVVPPPKVDAKSKLCSGRLSQGDALLLSKHKSISLFTRCSQWLARLKSVECHTVSALGNNNEDNQNAFQLMMS